MSATHTMLEGQLRVSDLVREAAERCLAMAPTVTKEEENQELPFGSGSIFVREVQPGLRCEAVALNCHKDQEIEVHSAPIIACNITLDGVFEGIDINGYGKLENAFERATLMGLGEPSHWKRRLRAGRHFKTFSFVITPVFFERFAGAIEDAQLAVFEPFRHGRRSVILPPSQRLISLGHNAFDRPYTGALDAIYHESNTLQFVLEVATLLSEEDVLVNKIGRKHYERLMHARAILDGALIDPPKTLDLARQVGTNVNTLQSHFKLAFKTTIFAYLRARRLEMARVLITEHNLSSKETAFRVGFSNPAAFTAAYRRYFGRPPMAEEK